MRTLENPDERLPREAPVRPLVVLAVDNDETRATYAYALTATGFDVTTANDDATWQAHGPETRPDIIVADVSPGSRHGWMLVQKLKRDLPTSEIPIVAVVADADSMTRERAQREHCAAVCVKTCPAEVFASGLRAVLERASRSTG
jgi:CheY-like chemotaxis protein